MLFIKQFVHNHRSVIALLASCSIQVAFLYLCYAWVEWQVSAITLMFTLLGASALWFFLASIRFPYRPYIATGMYGISVVYAISNIVYIEVFDSFISLGASTDLATIIPTIKEFAHTITLLQYTVAILTIVGSVWSVTMVRSWYQKPLWHTALFSLTFVCAFIALVSYTIAKPNPDWWQIQQKQQALGMYGSWAESSINTILHAGIDTTYASSLHGQLDATIQQTTSSVDLPLTMVSDEKPHVIIFQMESIPAWGMEHGIEAMPYLSELIKNNIAVDAFYPNGCHTIDAELTMLCSQYSHTEKAIAQVGTEEEYHCLPHMLKDRYAYETVSFHADNTDFWSRDVLHPKWGFDTLRFTPEFPLKMPDEFLLEEAVDFLATQEAPTFIDVIGFSSHAPHTFSMMEGFKKSFDYDISSYEGPLSADLVSRIELAHEVDVRAFLGFMTSIDNSIKTLMEALEEKGLRDNTIVVIVSDHRYYGFKDKSKQNFFDYNRVPFVIITPQGMQQHVAGISSHIDIAPTLLHLIEGETYKAPETFIGKSLFDPNRSNEVFMACQGNLQYSNNDELIIQTVKKGSGYNIVSNDATVPERQIQQLVNQMQQRAFLIDSLYAAQ